MPNQDWPGAERRAHQRVAFQASARLFTAERIVGDYAVKDLSVGGAMLCGQVDPTVGTVLGVVFGVWIASTELGTINASAQVVRVTHAPDGRVNVGLSFIQAPSKIEAMIQEVVLAELARASKAAAQTATTDA